MVTQVAITYRLVIINYDFDVSAKESGALRPAQKVSPLGGSFGSTVISTKNFQKFRPEPLPPYLERLYLISCPSTQVSIVFHVDSDVDFQFLAKQIKFQSTEYAITLECYVYCC